MHAERAGVSIKFFASWNKTKRSNSADTHKCVVSGKAEQIKCGGGCVYPVFKTTPIEVLTATDIDEVLQSVIEQLLKKIDDFEERGSGWVLHELSRLDLHTYIHDPLRASTYTPVPDDLKAKQAVVNIQNKVWVSLHFC